MMVINYKEQLEKLISEVGDIGDHPHKKRYCDLIKFAREMAGLLDDIVIMTTFMDGEK